MNRTVILKEYQQKSLKDINKEIEDKYPNGCSCGINADDLDKIEKYLIKIGHSSALKITLSYIKAKSFVGVIKYKNIQIEILPKLISELDNNKEDINEDEKSQILNNLIFMLSYTKKLDIKTSDCAKLSKTSNPFLEVLIREYANSMFEALKRLTPRNYIREEDNLNYLKGKLKFSENIRYNCVNQSKFYCEYDEFSEDCVLNQLFYFVSVCLYSVSKDSKNKSILKFIMDYFCEIKLIPFNSDKCEKIRLARNQQMFEKPFKLAKMFVENSSVDLSKNKFENITMLWDMNKLFEEFIYQIIRKHLSSKDGITNITAQKQKKLLKKKDKTDKTTYRDTKADIFITTENGKIIIIDTKYKKFEKFEDISSSDIYQVCAYSLLHDDHSELLRMLQDSQNNDHSEKEKINSSKIERTILLYPKYSNKSKNITGFQINSVIPYNIDFGIIDLKYPDLKQNTDNKIKNSLKNIIEGKTDD